jgi:hypothetical protein
MAKDQIKVNVADPKDIEAKMPQVRALLEKKRAELEELQAQVKVLDRIVGKEPASAAANGQAPKASRKTVAPSQERAIRALEQAGRPMGPTSLYEFMQRERITPLPRDANALGASLWAAAKAGRIGKAPNGVYVPPGMSADRPLTDYDEAARKGMPVPASFGDSNGVATQASLNGASREGENREIRLEVGSQDGPG